MRTRGLALGLLLVAASAGAQADDALAATVDPDPMELARAARRAGDAAVLSRLDASITAIRAAPELPAPELAVPTLADVAAGRDPWLAPAAAQSLLRITRDLTALGLDRREADVAGLVDASARLGALADDETARADLRVAARLAADRLSSLTTRPATPG